MSEKPITCLEDKETDDGWAFCVLPHGHDGPHQFVSDDEIMVFPVEQIRQSPEAVT